MYFKNSKPFGDNFYPLVDIFIFSGSIIFFYSYISHPHIVAFLLWLRNCLVADSLSLALSLSVIQTLGEVLIMHSVFGKNLISFF